MRDDFVDLLDAIKSRRQCFQTPTYFEEQTLLPSCDSKISELVPRPCKHKNFMVSGADLVEAKAETKQLPRAFLTAE